jgi:adenylate cyclase
MLPSWLISCRPCRATLPVALECDMIQGPNIGARVCKACGQPAPADARFCLQCGTPVTPTAGADCPACQTINPDRAKFCLACGAPLSSPAQADRRVVTVLFADLSGFTQMSEEADPEEVRELIAACLDKLCQCVTRWDGYVDKFIGDCVMALFGAPVAYENEAERAIRAALAMQEALRDWSPPRNLLSESEAGYKPQLRIGICTGPVVTGLFAGGGALNYTAVGDSAQPATSWWMPRPTNRPSTSSISMTSRSCRSKDGVNRFVPDT